MTTQSRRTLGRVGAAFAISGALGFSIPTFADQPPNLVDGQVYTADEKGNSLTVIDLKTRRTETVPVAISPHNVQISPDGKRLYAVGTPAAKDDAHGRHGDRRGRLLVFDAAALGEGPLAAIDVGVHPAHVVVDAKGALAFVTNGGDNTVSVVDLAQRRVVRTVATGAYPHGLRISPDGREVWIANVTGGSVTVVRTADFSAATIAIGREPVQVAFAPDGRRVYVSLRRENRVAAVDTASRRVLAKVTVGRGPVQVYATPDGRYVLAANQGGKTPDNTVSVIAAATDRVVKTLVTGRGAHGVVVSDDGAWAFVTNILDNSVAVIDLGKLAVVATYKVGRGPNGVTYRRAAPPRS